MHSVWTKSNLPGTYHLRFLLSWRRSGHCWLPWLYKWSLSQSSMGTSKGCHGLGSILPKVFPFFPVSTKKWTSHMPFGWLQGLSNVHSSYSFMVYRWVYVFIFWCSWSTFSTTRKFDFDETSPRNTPMRHFPGCLSFSHQPGLDIPGLRHGFHHTCAWGGLRSVAGEECANLGVKRTAKEATGCATWCEICCRRENTLQGYARK